MKEFFYSDYGIMVITLIFLALMLAFGGFVAGFIIGDQQRREDRIFNQRRDEYHSEI
jgi:hypothetical protein